MNERRSMNAGPRSAGDAAGARLRSDFESLARVSRKNMPDMDDTARALRSAMADDREEGFTMAILRYAGDRRRWTTAVAAGFLAAVFLFVPVSYQKTVGHEVAVEISAAALGDAGAAALGDELRDALGAPGASVRATGDGAYELAARVYGGSPKDLNGRLAAFTTDLAGRGVATATAVRPIKEEVRGNVYLAAANSIITLRVDDRSADEIAGDLRSQLESAGIYDADVEVSSEGGCQRVCVRAESHAAGDMPEIRCETADGTCKSIEVRLTEEMSDAEMIAEIERQLASQGISADVTIGPDGKPNIEFQGGCD